MMNEELDVNLLNNDRLRCRKRNISTGQNNKRGERSLSFALQNYVAPYYILVDNLLFAQRKGIQSGAAFIIKFA